MTGHVLVTGGAGFIGSHVVDGLLADGYRVRVYDSLVEQVHGTDGPRHLARKAELRVADMCDRDALREALKGVDAVLHLAAEVGVGQSMYEISRYVDANTGGTGVLLDLLANEPHSVSRVVVASSMSIYGEGAYRCAKHGDVAPRPRTESQLREKDWEVRCPRCQQQLRPIATRETKPLNPTSVYAISKMDQELMCLSVCDAYGIGSVALRFFNTYGPRQALSNPYTGVGAIFSSRLLNGRPPLVYEDGQQLRDFIHVSDVARCVRVALESDATGVACNVGTGKPVTVEGVALRLAKELGVDLEPEITEHYRAGDIRHCWADAEETAEILGFRAEVDFEDGVAELVEWVAHEEAQDTVEQARAELERRGLVR